MSEYDAAQAAVQAALDAGARYADARVMHRRNESMTARNGDIDRSAGADAGVGVRALIGSSWGFFAVADLDRRRRPAPAGEGAAETARAARSRSGAALELAPSRRSPPTGRASASRTRSVSLGRQGRPARRRDRRPGRGRRPRRGASTRSGTPGSGSPPARAHRISQRVRESGAGMAATAIGDGETQRRSYPGLRGQYGTRGWELVAELDLPANAARIGEEARALLTAPACPSGATDLILGGEQMALQIHESVGHATELDRILGWEAAFAGTSWLDLSQLGSLRFGSELMNITADATIPGALGSFGYDDEGTPAHTRRHRAGRHMGRRAAGPGLGRPRRHRLRGDGPGRRPRPAADGADDQHRPASRVRTPSSRWSPRPTTGSSWTPTARGRSTTAASTSSSAARSPGRSRTGGSAGMLRNPTYTGISPRFWGSMDMVGRLGAGRLGHAQLRQGPAHARSATPGTRRCRAGSVASGWGCGDDRHRRRGRAGRLGRRRWPGAEAAATVRRAGRG